MFPSAAADTECILVPEEADDDGEERTTVTTHEHLPCAIGYKVSSDDPEMAEDVKYLQGRDSMDRFVDKMFELKDRVKDRIAMNVPMKPASAEQMEIFESEPDCHICLLPFTGERDLDHDHR